MNAPPPSPHRRCRHLFYGMTCAEYDDLLEAQAGNCGVCQGEASGRGSALQIDHDHALGTWAVRGLICHYCNSGLLMMVDSGRWTAVPMVVDYLAAAWHLTHRPSGLGQVS